MRTFTRFTLLFLLTAATYAANPEWTAQLPGVVKWEQVTSVGSLLVGTPGSLVCIDPDSGQLLWQRDDLDNTAAFNVREVTGTPVLLVKRTEGLVATGAKVEAVDLTNGKTLWSQQVPGFAVGFFPVPAQNLALLFQSAWQQSGHALKIFAYNLQTGDKLWEAPYGDGRGVALHISDNSGKFLMHVDLSGHQEPVAEGDLLYVPFVGVHCIDLKTGAQKWGVPFSPAHKNFKKAYAPLLMKDDTVYASGLGEVYAIDKATGTVRWKSKKIGSGIISEIQVVNDTVYVRVGGNFYDTAAKQWKLDQPLMVLALDKASGQQLWEFRNIKDGITNMKPLPEQKTLMIADARNLIGLDTDSRGKATEKFRVPLKFTRSLGGGEVAAKVVRGLTGGLMGIAKAATAGDKERLDVPVGIYDQDGGKLIVRGKQHLLQFDPATQQLVWSTYYAAPGAPGWETTIMTVLTAASSMYYSAAAYSGQMDTRGAVQGKERAFEQFDRSANKRFQATKSAGDYTYILSVVEEEGKKGIGLIAIDMKTGDPAKQIILHEKDPEYIVDDLTGRLYFFKGKKQLEAYTLR